MGKHRASTTHRTHESADTVSSPESALIIGGRMWLVYFIIRYWVNS